MDERIKLIIESLIFQYPQKSENLINWVFTGGVSVNLFLYYEIKNYEKFSNISFNRYNLDIDIYNFKKNKLHDSNNFLNLFQINKEMNVSKIINEKNYNKDYYYIDSLYNYHFDFILPERNDIVEISFENKKIYSLSPEFIVIFKCFGYRGFRKKDYRDSIRILISLKLNEEYLWKLFKKTNFFNYIPSFISQDNLIYYIKTKEIFLYLNNNMKQLFYRNYNVIGERELDYSNMVKLVYKNFHYLNKYQKDLIYQIKESNLKINHLKSGIATLLLIHDLNQQISLELIKIILEYFEKLIEYGKLNQEKAYIYLYYLGRYYDFNNIKNNIDLGNILNKIFSTEFYTLNLISLFTSY